MSISISKFYCVCVKRITLCNCLCSSSSPSSRNFASVICDIKKFGAKNYFTDHPTFNTIHSFRDSFSVLKIHGCYQDTQKFEQLSIPIQVIRGQNGVLMQLLRTILSFCSMLPSIILVQCQGNLCNVGATFEATGYYQKIPV